MKTIKQLIIIFLLINSYYLKGQAELPNSISIADNDGSLYWMGTIGFSAINSTTTYFNIRKLHKYDKYRSNAIFGVISGAAQTSLGFSNFSAKNKNAFIPTSINVGIGLTTLLTSIVRLATKNPPKENSIKMSFMYIPSHDEHNSIVGLTLRKQLN